MSCQGQDNANSHWCTIGYVQNIFVGNAGDHTGSFYLFFRLLDDLTTEYTPHVFNEYLTTEKLPRTKLKIYDLAIHDKFPLRNTMYSRRIFLPNLTPFAATSQCNS